MRAVVVAALALTVASGCATPRRAADGEPPLTQGQAVGAGVVQVGFGAPLVLGGSLGLLGGAITGAYVASVAPSAPPGTFDPLVASLVVGSIISVAELVVGGVLVMHGADTIEAALAPARQPSVRIIRRNRRNRDLPSAKEWENYTPRPDVDDEPPSKRELIPVD
jgi:hypothetical protein